MLCKWYQSQPCWKSAHKHLTGSCLTSHFHHHWLLCYFWVNAEKSLFFWVDIYGGSRVVEDSITCATHSRLKQSHNPSEEHWRVEACFGHLPHHLAVAKHTHRSRHGTKCWQSLCLTEGGWHSSSKKGGGGWQNYKEMNLKLTGKGKEKLHYYQAISFLKTKFSEKT